MRKNIMNYSLVVFIFISVFLFFGQIKKAQADLMVTPLRVVFEDRTRSAVVTIINVSNKTNTYRMEWKLFKMNEQGKYDELPQSDNSDFAKRARKLTEMVRFSPRQVVVAPGETQRVRLSLRRQADLEEGEYRAHLSFSKLPEIPKPSATDKKGIEFKLYMQLSFTIPVIFRNGGTTSASINKIEFISPKKDVKNKLSLKVDLEHVGNNTAFGKVLVFWTPKNRGKEQQIGLLNNVSLYPELTRRIIKIPLDVDNIDNGVLRIVYQGDGEYRGSIFDEKNFDIE